jgi:GT2 family glycosyltransferase
MSQSPQPRACIAITTKNRKDELRKAVRSALAQTVPVEVLVVDDGSDDGTSEMIRSEFPVREHPHVRLDRNEKSLGLIAQRCRFPALTACPFIFSIDDDAILVSPKTVEQTLGEFEHPRVGVVAIPYIDVNYGPEVKQRAPGVAPAGDFWVSEQYRGTAHALRRDVFVALGGYRPLLVRQGEEMDYCIRMLDAGYVVRLGGADPIHHMESPRRSRPQISMYSGRNHVLFAWHNVPMPNLLMHLPATVAKQLKAGAKDRHVPHSIQGLARGLGLAVSAEMLKRSPVRRSTYLFSRRLRKQGPFLLSQIENELPPMRAV